MVFLTLDLKLLEIKYMIFEKREVPMDFKKIFIKPLNMLADDNEPL